MCFAPQRLALFRHLNFQKWSEHGDHGVFCTFWLGNVLRAITACNFSSLIWPDGSAPAALESLLFDPPEPQIIGKTQCFATFLPFRASASSFFWLFLFLLLFSLPLPCSAFHLSILSEVWLLNFLRLYTIYTENRHVLTAIYWWFNHHSMVDNLSLLSTLHSRAAGLVAVSLRWTSPASSGMVEGSFCWLPSLRTATGR